jgi:hypothetical protein
MRVTEQSWRCGVDESSNSSRGVVVFTMKERVKGQEEGEENKMDEMAVCQAALPLVSFVTG